jgi:hypothetical protein
MNPESDELSGFLFLIYFWIFSFNYPQTWTASINDSAFRKFSHAPILDVTISSSHPLTMNHQDIYFDEKLRI